MSWVTCFLLMPTFSARVAAISDLVMALAIYDLLLVADGQASPVPLFGGVEDAVPFRLRGTSSSPWLLLKGATNVAKKPGVSMLSTRNWRIFRRILIPMPKICRKNRGNCNPVRGPAAEAVSPS